MENTTAPDPAASPADDHPEAEQRFVDDCLTALAIYILPGMLYGDAEKAE
jgi:hypothetical protein